MNQIREDFLVEMRETFAGLNATLNPIYRKIEPDAALEEVLQMYDAPDMTGECMDRIVDDWHLRGTRGVSHLYLSILNPLRFTEFEPNELDCYLAAMCDPDIRSTYLDLSDHFFDQFSTLHVVTSELVLGQNPGLIMDFKYEFASKSVSGTLDIDVADPCSTESFPILHIGAGDNRRILGAMGWTPAELMTHPGIEEHLTDLRAAIANGTVRRGTGCCEENEVPRP